ncbi:MAG: thiamine pyrophosphate-dependent enzyme [Dehalococcoidales bacterium]|jgi:pyruvate ferredoxin oxidoreductase alpha subunit
MSEIKALTGNEAIAYGVRLARPKVIAAYPITPQTTIVETLANFVADGSLKAQFVESEGEHGAIFTVMSAALTGVRVFTGTSSQGFAYGYEAIAYIPGRRLPVVMAVANRPISSPGKAVECDHSDTMSGRDLGWIQLYVESNQEALDTIIQAYRIAEDQKVLLPVMVCIDGFYITHTTEMVQIPEQADVDKFIPPYEPKHVILDPANPMALSGGGTSDENMGYEFLKNEAVIRAGDVIKQANDEYAAMSGRKYGNGLVEKLYCDDAEIVLVTMGSMSGNARLTVEQLRAEGKKVGLVRVRSFRPFPKDDFLALGKKVKVIAVVDRSVSRGAGEGPCVTEIKSALYNVEGEKARVIGFIAGLHSAEILTTDFRYMADKALKTAATGQVTGEIEWIPNFEITTKNPVPVKHDKLLYPGTTACPGCGMALVVRKVVEAFGQNTMLVENIGCGAWNAAQGMGSITGIGLAAFPSMPLPSGSACATGISLGLKEKGQEDTKVVLIGGDGSLGDIGFTALSGAAERNSDFLCVTEDNEAYANTGIQRSGATPQYAWTTTTPVGEAEKGKSTPRKDMPLIIAAHRVPYVATASLAYMDDFMKKLAKARQMRGFRYIHVYTPCPTSWRFPPEKMIQVSRLGVTTGIFTLYEIEDGKLTITVKPEKFKPVGDYLKLQGRFSHLTDEDIEKIQHDVDIAQAQMYDWEKSGLSLPVASG